MRSALLVSCLTLSTFALAWAEGADTFQNWNKVSVRVWENQWVALTAGAQLRVRDSMDEPYRWQGSLNLSYQWFAHTSASLGFTTFEDNFDRPNSQLEYRLYPALSHKIPLTEFLILKIRNRIDFRKREFEDDFANRSRHRFGLQYNISGRGPLNYLFASNEFFINWETGRLDQNRVIPAGLGFRINEHISMETYYLLRMDEKGDRWDGIHILGTHLKLKF